MKVNQLKEWLSYDPSTGYFTWLHPPNRRIKEGSIAGSPLKHGHIKIRFQGKQFLAHRLAWLFSYRTWPTNQIDHINRNPSDNRLINLRESTQAENTQNTGATGVTQQKHTGKWISKIMLRGKVYHLGVYESRSDACAAYLRKKQELHPFFYIN